MLLFAHGLSAIDPHLRLWISLRMLTNCQESGLGPMHVCMGTTEPMSTSSRSSGRLWVQASELGLIQGVQTFVLTLMDVTPLRLSSSDARGPDLQ